MSGALIVEGGIDHHPALRGVTEKVMVFQQVVYREQQGMPAEVLPADVYSTATQFKTLINGQLVPVISMRPGEVQRWRMIHAGIASTINVNLDNHILHEIAYDGIPLKAMHEFKQGHSELQPGYRVDVLVRANDLPSNVTRKVYALYNRVPDPSQAILGRTVAAQLLAKVVVEGPPANMELPGPGAWSGWVADLYNTAPMRDLKDIPDPGANNRTFTLKNSDDPKNLIYTINDHVFRADRIERITLGSVEQWALKSSRGTHPFHIHVNPFQVQVAYPDGSNPWVWRDTLFIAPNRPATIRSRFVGFTGKTVLHCHNLQHEDQGMMQAICIEDPKDPDPDCKVAAAAPVARAGPAPAWRLRGGAGRAVASSDYRGRRLLLVFHLGFSCWHCAEQLALLDRSADAFRDLGIDILVVSPRADPDGRSPTPNAGTGPFVFLDDPTLDAFRAYGCLASGQVLHGAFLIDGSGLIQWGRVGERPETDIDLILENAGKLAGPDRAAITTPARR